MPCFARLSFCPYSTLLYPTCDAHLSSIGAFPFLLTAMAAQQVTGLVGLSFVAVVNKRYRAQRRSVHGML